MTSATQTRLPTYEQQVRAERNAQIVAASRAGEWASTIAERFGITPRTVYRVRATARRDR